MRHGVNEIHRKLLSLAGFHASHDRDYTPKNSVHFIPNDSWLNRKLPDAVQPKANRLPNQPDEKGRTYVNKAQFRTGLLTVKAGDYKIAYAIYPEKVVIHDISYTDTRLSQLDSKERNGLYHVVQENGFWRVAQSVRQVITLYAAVNGQSNNLNKAVWLMGEHLVTRYGQQVREYTLFHNRTYGGRRDTYQSMVNKMAVTTRTARQLCAIMQDCQARHHKVRWMGHSQGAIMIHEAVNWHLNTHGRGTAGAAVRTTARRTKAPMAAMAPLARGGAKAAAVAASALSGAPLSPEQADDIMDYTGAKAQSAGQGAKGGIKSGAKASAVAASALSGAPLSPAEAQGMVDYAGAEFGATSLAGPLDMHTVALHGAATNKTAVAASFKAAGVHYYADVSHPLDLVNTLTGVNWKSRMEMAGSLLFGNHVTGGTASQSPHTLPFVGFEEWEQRMQRGHPDFPNEFGAGMSKEQRTFVKANRVALKEAAKNRNFVDDKISSLVD